MTNSIVHFIHGREHQQPDNLRTRALGGIRARHNDTTTTKRSALLSRRRGAVFRGTFPTRPLCPGFSLPGDPYPPCEVAFCGPPGPQRYPSATPQRIERRNEK